MTQTQANARRAVIDIGSNTVRLVIFGGPPRAPVVLLNEKVAARLGKGVGEAGALSAKTMAAALTALGRFAALLEASGISQIHTVATAAVRDAANGEAFLAEVTRLGLKPRLLAGEEEALASAMGVAGAFPGARGVVADLGGGSLELIKLGPDRCEHGCSLPIGSLRLPALRADGPARFRRQIHRIVKAPGVACLPDEELYLVGGSLRAFARYHMHHAGSPLDDPHGHGAIPATIAAACRSILRTRRLYPVPGISPARLAALPDTAALLSVLVDTLAPARVVFSTWGLREGLLFGALSPIQRRLDPLAAGVRAFAEARSAPAAVAAMVAGWTARVARKHGPLQENLRLSATMLAMALQQVEPNLRADTALGWALHKRWIGIGPAGRAMLAACLLANAGRPLPSTLSALADEEEIAEATAWGLAIRLCRRLTGLAPQLFSECALRIEKSDLILSLNPRAVPLATDLVERDLAALAGHIGLAAKLERA